MGVKKATESDLVRQVLDYLRLKGILAFRVSNVPTYDRKAGRYRKFTGMPGVSDVLAVLPGGKLMAAEMKVKPNRLTPHQEAFLDAVNRAGGVGITVYDLKDLQAALAQEGV